MTLVLGLGGNVGGDAAILDRFAAVAGGLAGWGPVRASRVYRTAPIGPPQPDFLNAAIALDGADAVEPAALAARIAELERALGRDRAREERWGPRTIDVDALVWGERALATPLAIPHPRLAARRFALAPLADLVGGDLRVPGAGRVGDLLAAVAAQGLSATGYRIRLP